MSPAKKPAAAEVFVLSESSTAVFPDLGLELPAGVPVLIPADLLERVLALPGVAQVFPDPTIPEE